MDNSYLWDFLEKGDDGVIVDSFVKADSVINNPKYSKVLCSISGGSDSDIILDLITKVDRDKKVRYVWYNTGLEYQATKDHLEYLENRYSVTIERERAIKPIPIACKEYGQPFLSKFVSEQISRLQTIGFTWEDRPLEELLEEYPKSVSALKWFCNGYGSYEGRPNTFNIARNIYLKEFLLENPPTFKISSKCCYYAKKKVAKTLIKEMDADLNIIGIRRSEGGIRATAYKTCFDFNENGADLYRPIFWYSQENKRNYEEKFNIVHSECYTKYNFARTGCACCPYGGKNLEHELEKTKIYEPKLYKAVNFVFKESYEYTRQYREFVKKKKQEKKRNSKYYQMTIEDFLKEG